MKPLHILIVSEYFPPHIGGVEVFFSELRKALVAEGHRVDVVTTSQADAPAIEKDKGGEIHRVKVPQSGDRYAFTALAIPKVLKMSRGVDIIHTTTYNAIPSAWLASLLRRKKSVVTVHEVVGPRWKHFIPNKPLISSTVRLIEWTLLKFPFTHSVAVSKATQKDLPRRHKRRSSVIYHGIDDLFSPRSKSPHTPPHRFLFFGRSNAQKGLWLLLNTLPSFFEDKAAQEKAQFKLIVSANDAEMLKIRTFLRRESLDKYVELSGSVPRKQIPKEIKASTAVVIPSLAEGFGFTTAESCACRVPVIVSDASSLPEVASGKHLTFKSGSQTGLLKALNKALANKWDYSPTKTFSWTKAAKEYEELYRSLI